MVSPQTDISLLLENDQTFAKINKKTLFLAVRAHFWLFKKKTLKTTPDFFEEKSKTGLGFEIGQPQRRFQRRPTLQSMANPAVMYVSRNICAVLLFYHDHSSTLVSLHSWVWGFWVMKSKRWYIETHRRMYVHRIVNFSWLLILVARFITRKVHARLEEQTVHTNWAVVK